MAVPFLNDIDLNGNEIFNLTIHNVSSFPEVRQGKVIWHTGNNKYYICDGTDWLPLATEGYVGNEITSVMNALSTHEGLDTVTDNAHGAKTYVDNEISSLNTTLSGDISTVSSNLSTHEGLTTELDDAHGSKTYIDNEVTTLNSDISTLETNLNNHETAASPHTDHEVVSNKGAANGYAGLDANAKVPLTQLPDDSQQITTVGLSTDTKPADATAADKFFETDTGDSYIYDGTSWVIMADADWANVSLDWTNITNKPTSTVTEIDNAVTFTQGSDSFNSAGDYTNLRARATTATDVGLGNVDNYSRADYDGRYLQIANNLSDLTNVSSARSSLLLDNVADKFTAVIGDGVKTSYNISNPSPDSNIEDLMVQVTENQGNYSTVFPNVERDTTNNQITIVFSEAPALEEYRVIIVG